MRKVQVAIINGIRDQPTYNAFLAHKYKELGYEVTIHSFTFGKLLFFPFHKYLKNDVKNIIDNNDIIHCLSASAYPIAPFLTKNSINKPVIFECPPLHTSAGAMLSGLGIVKSKKVNVEWLQKIMNIFIAPPLHINVFLNSFDKLCISKQALHVQCVKDNVADIYGREHLVHHMFENGKHARVFYDNDFNIVEDYINGFKY